MLKTKHMEILERKGGPDIKKLDEQGKQHAKDSKHKQGQSYPPKTYPSSGKK
jgi:hypothetical protein